MKYNTVLFLSGLHALKFVSALADARHFVEHHVSTDGRKVLAFVKKHSTKIRLIILDPSQSFSGIENKDDIPPGVALSIEITKLCPAPIYVFNPLDDPSPDSLLARVSTHLS